MQPVVTTATNPQKERNPVKNEQQHERDERAQVVRAGSKREDKELVHFAARPAALAFLHLESAGEVRLISSRPKQAQAAGGRRITAGSLAFCQVSGASRPPLKV